MYRAAALNHVTAAECDASEIWVLAAQLGANEPDDSDPLTDDDGLTWNQRRAVALARGEPEPTWDEQPLSAKEQADMDRLMAAAPAGMVPPEGLSPT